MDVSSAAAPMQRIDARLCLTVRDHGGTSRLASMHETGGLRWRFLRRQPQAPVSAVQLNTAGGLAGGDRQEVAIEIGPKAEALVTSQAAERVYRTLGPLTEITTTIRVEAGARLVWLPQETLIYNQARLRRRTDVAIAESGSLVVCDMLVFGRHASGERVVGGLIDDRWRFTRDGRLILHDPFHLAGPIDDLLQRPAIADGARAVATVTGICVGPLDSWRAAAEECGERAAAGAVRGILRARLLAATGGALKVALARFLSRIGHAPPRAWQC